MCDCSKSKNQTGKEVYAFLSQKNNLDELTGIGLFLVPAPENGILETKVVAVDHLSLKEVGKRGANCEAFQFIPHGFSFQSNKSAVSINGIADLKNIDCGGCPDCRTGCFCSVWFYCIKY